MATRDAHFRRSDGEGEISTVTTLPGLEDAVRSSRAQQRRPSRHVSWASSAHMGLTETHLSVGRWRRTTATLGWLRERLLVATTCARF